MNELDDKLLLKQSFSYLNMLGQDRWESWTPVFTSLTVVGTPTYTGRYKVVGRMCFIQVQLSAATSIQNTPAGTAYFDLPITASGLAGLFCCSDETTKAGTGICWMDHATSRVYLPAITPATSDHFDVAGWYEV